jgi:hypothetical protein
MDDPLRNTLNKFISNEYTRTVHDGKRNRSIYEEDTNCYFNDNLDDSSSDGGRSHSSRRKPHLKRKKNRDHETPEVRDQSDATANKHMEKSLAVATGKSIADHESILNTIDIFQLEKKEQLKNYSKKQDQDHEYRLFTATTQRLIVAKEIEEVKLEQMKLRKASCCIQ